jgi:hypothetical protein
VIRVIPDIPHIRARYAHRCSEIPDWLEVPLSDGRTVRYYPQVEQPAFTRAIQNIRNMVVGYERPADAATSNRPHRKEKDNNG